MRRGPSGLVPTRGIVRRTLHELVNRHASPIDVHLHVCEPLIDSADVSYRHWNQLGALIVEHHSGSDGIVVVHGTDTLAYTAAAMACSLEGLRIPIVFTGAMRPLEHPDTDGRRNLEDAIRAALTTAPGAWVQFAGKLMEGDKVTKTSSTDTDAFTEVDSVEKFATCRYGERVRMHDFGDLRIQVVSVSPFLSAEVIAALRPHVDGIVLRCYGAGSVQSDGSWHEVLSSTVRGGTRVVAVSQCVRGGLRLFEYPSGAMLREAGVEDAGSLTVEAASVRLARELSDSAARAR